MPGYLPTLLILIATVLIGTMVGEIAFHVVRHLLLRRKRHAEERLHQAEEQLHQAKVRRLHLFTARYKREG